MRLRKRSVAFVAVSIVHASGRRPAPRPAGGRSRRAGDPAEVVSVRDFGAKGDARTDDTAAFQNALDAVGKSGGTVQAGRGNFYFAGHLNVPAGVPWKASGNRSLRTPAFATRVWPSLPTTAPRFSSPKTTARRPARRSSP